MGRSIAYDRAWRERNREKLRVYHRLYARRRRGNKDASTRFLGTSGEGRKYEGIAREILEGSLDKNSESFHGPWDLEWRGLRIDVKKRSPSAGRYCFTKKNTCRADHFLCFCVKDDLILDVFLFPSSVFGKAISFKEDDLERFKAYRLTQ